MVDSKGNFEWQQTSSIESILLNINRSSKSKVISPNELNPYMAHKHKNKITGQFAWKLFRKVFQNKTQSKE